jgi:hypothetical protein
MILTKPGRCHLREEASEPCLKVAHRVSYRGAATCLELGEDRK